MSLLRRSATKETLPASREEEQIYINADQFFDQLLAAVAVAKQSIDVEMYIYGNDTLAERVTSALIEAHRRGVHVRVLVDGVGTPLWPHTQGLRLIEAAIESKIYHPLPWSTLHRHVRAIQTSARWISRLNRRDHRKMFLIDQHQAWLGSVNICDDHLISLRKEKAWRDTTLKIRSEDTVYLNAAFEYAWIGSTRGRRAHRKQLRRLLTRSKSSAIRINATHRLRRYHHKQLLQRIRRAQDRVWICSPYFVPTISLLRAFHGAAKRGIDIRMLVPGPSDVIFMAWVAGAFQRSLVAAGIRVYRYQPSILHAKTMLIDDWAVIGSSNLNHRSLIHDLEVDAVLTHPSNRQELATQFENDFKVSLEFDAGTTSLWNFFEAFLGRFILLFKRWI